MKMHLKIGFLLLLPFFTKAQPHQKELDSLHMALKNAADDTVKMITLYNLASYYGASNWDSAMLFVENAISIAKKMNQQIWIANFLLFKSNLVLKQTNFSLSLKLCNEALAIIQDKRNEKNAYIQKDDEFATEPEKYRKSFKMNVFHELGNTWLGAGNKEKAIEYYKKEIQVSEELNTNAGLTNSNMYIGDIYLGMDNFDSAFIYSKRALGNANLTGNKLMVGVILRHIGTIYFKNGQLDSAKHYYQQSVLVNKEQNNVTLEITTNIALARLYQKLLQADSMKYFANKALQFATKIKAADSIGSAANLLSDAWKMQGNADSAFAYLSISKTLGDSLSKYRNEKLTQFQNTNFEEQMRLEKEAQESVITKNKLRTTALFIGLGLFSILAFVFYRNNRQKQKANAVLQEQKQKVETTLYELKQTQSQLIQSEKMASLGELTAGIAHEIQNPLNFVNNFSEVNKELLLEMKDEIDKGNLEEVKVLAKDVIENEEKINHHGKRADAIVKGMLQHSRSSSGQKEPTDINDLCDEYFRLAYHGLKAKDKSFNATMKTDFDETIGVVNIIPQDIGRVILNLLTNAFYVVDGKKKSGIENYEPTVSINTKKIGNKVEIKVTDNGNGIPPKILDKIFQPFFTTKPTGQGTGLGLSLSYDIVKAHAGELKVETKDAEGSVFIIQLPL